MNTDDAKAVSRSGPHACQSGAAHVRFTRTAVVLHWLLALLLLGQLAFGWLVLAAIPRNTPARGFWVNQHKSIGLVIGLLILLRIYWRLRHPPPPSLPAPVWQLRAAGASHLALYVCMVVMPLSGYLASNFSKYGITLFNMVRLAPWGSDDKVIYAFFNQVHAMTALVLALAIVVHVLAVAKHMWIDRDDLLRRMWLR